TIKRMQIHLVIPAQFDYTFWKKLKQVKNTLGAQTKETKRIIRRNINIGKPS
ncbi:MAG: hypothetical protein JWR18_2979, partial [Segetibacter sp.]|nr:hypothetical protein [Segetibacter sp.]